jgi:hypothetical protein
MCLGRSLLMVSISCVVTDQHFALHFALHRRTRSDISSTRARESVAGASGGGAPEPMHRIGSHEPQVSQRLATGQPAPCRGRRLRCTL